MRYNNDRRHFRGHPHEPRRANNHSVRRPAHGGLPPALNHSHWMEERPERDEMPEETPDPTATGSEAVYLHSLVESKKLVTVLLKTGDRLRGRIRYYDREMLSLGQTDGGPNIFLPKHSIHQIIEE
jgi:sRNA-binding regulator protein Hfq